MRCLEAGARKHRSYQPGNFAGLSELSIVGKDNLFVRLRIECRHRADRAAASSRRQVTSSLFDVLPLLRAHAGDRVSVRATSNLRGHIVPVAEGQVFRVHRKREGIARMRDQAADDGVLDVGEGPVVDGNASRGLPKDSDLGRISTECGDVVAHPLDGKTLVAEAEVVDVVRCTRKSEDVETIVDGHDHNVVRIGEILAVVEGRVRGTNRCSSSVEKDKHGAVFTTALLLHRLRPDVQRQAVFIPSSISVPAEVIDNLLSLWCQEVEIERRPGALRTVAARVSIEVRYAR